MIKALINASLQHRGLVFLLTALLVAAGVYAVRATPVDAIPDLSDVQVIIKTQFPGQAPQVVEDQVTYPLSTAMLAVPGAVDVRGYSFFGDSYIYILFEEGTDLYWARSRVLEYLSQARPNLPESAQPALGPDATGVGWVYEYALVDRSGGNDLASLRSLQDWFLRYELQSLPGVAEVATIGGMVPQYQVLPDPHKLRLYGLTIAQLIQALEQGSAEAGGALIEMAEAISQTRKEIAAEIARAGSAPHGPPHGPGEAIYPGLCRGLTNTERQQRIGAGERYALRLDMSRALAEAETEHGGPLTWYDRAQGQQLCAPLPQGDVVLARKDAAASYHLAVVVDDAAQGVTLVTRGKDLFAASHVHRLLQALLGLPVPDYHHHGLVADDTGRRLAKRHDGLSIRQLRAAGRSAGDVIALAEKALLPPSAESRKDL